MCVCVCVYCVCVCVCVHVCVCLYMCVSALQAHWNVEPVGEYFTLHIRFPIVCFPRQLKTRKGTTIISQSLTKVFLYWQGSTKQEQTQKELSKDSAANLFKKLIVK